MLVVFAGIFVVGIDGAEMEHSGDDVGNFVVFLVISHFHGLILEINTVIQIAQD